MKLQLEKFGTTLISRELGGEAFKALQSTLREFPEDEELGNKLFWSINIVAVVGRRVFKSLVESIR